MIFIIHGIGCFKSVYVTLKMRHMTRDDVRFTIMNILRFFTRGEIETRSRLLI